jgi:N-acetylglutamate synthase-like GNAT family acetyltransferase
MTIREATKLDFLNLVEIMNKSASKKELKGFVPPTNETKKFLVKLRRQLEVSGHQVLVAEMNKRAVGFIYFTHDKEGMTIEEVDVIKQCQHRGIGKALVKRVERVAENKGVKYLTTGTAINAEGKPWKAYGFWIRMGYVVVGEKTDTGYGFKYCKLVKKLQYSPQTT